jgi:hypothetical protein
MVEPLLTTAMLQRAKMDRQYFDLTVPSSPYGVEWMNMLDGERFTVALFTVLHYQIEEGGYQ